MTTNAAAVARACRMIDAAEEPPRLDVLARAVGLSPFHFHRVFKAHTGVTPRLWAEGRRAARVRSGLRGGAAVTTAVFDAGYGSTGRFYEAAHRWLGMTPTAFRAGGAGTTIRFAIGASSLGALLVAATARGVCAIEFGDDPERLAREFQNRFPRARVIGADRGFERLVAAVVGLVERPGTPAPLPLDLRGTAFQLRVWNALRRIPPGATATYATIARGIGRPAAVRAVAGACAANRLAVAVPCHRIIRTDGSLSGYRWGVARKRALLAREAAPVSPPAASSSRRGPAASSTRSGPAPRRSARTPG